MANKQYTYDVCWAWASEGNRTIEGVERVKSTTVGRAINKAIKQLNIDPENPGDDDGRGASYLDKGHEDFIKASDVMIIACQNVTKGWDYAK